MPFFLVIIEKIKWISVTYIFNDYFELKILNFLKNILSNQRMSRKIKQRESAWFFFNLIERYYFQGVPF